MSLHLYTWATPNGHKPQIMLEELGEPYEVEPINIFTGDQLTEAFREINPNARIPALVDTEGPDGAPLKVFESGAILLYLAEKYGRFLPATARGRSEAIQWLMWQMGGLGPMIGQGQFFSSYAPEKHPYSMERYANEGQRLISVMERRLADHEYLADEYSIADIACFPWVRVHKMANVTIESSPNVQRWYGAIRNRPAVKRGLDVLRDQLTGIPKTEQAHDVLFGKTQFKNP